MKIVLFFWARWLIILKLQTAVGGGGGDIGKKINHGSGDGGDDDGDDDDYFDDFDDGDEGDEGGLFRRRKFLEEVKFSYIIKYTKPCSLSRLNVSSVNAVDINVF